MRLALFLLNSFLMMALPVVVGWWLARRFKVPWRLFLIGAVTFVLSQVAHIPFNQFVLNPIITGWARWGQFVALALSAGVFEEPARYLVYRFWIKRARSWREALMFGAGHGGSEAIIFGALAGLTAMQLQALSQMDLSTLGLSPEQLAAVTAQLDIFTSGPWYMAVLGAIERVWAMTFHISASVLVLQVFRRRGGFLWLLASILWHTLLNAVALLVLDAYGAVASEAALGVVSLGSLAIIYLLRDPPTPEGAELPPADPLPAPVAGPLEPPSLSAEALEKTQYQ